MYSLTIFKAVYDNKTHRRMNFDTWEEFEVLLYNLAQQPGYKAKKGEKKRSSPLISPAVFKPDTTRANDNVVEWGGWAALDVDDHVFEGDLEQELRNRYGKYHFVCYSTASSSIDHPKFRLVFPLTERIEQGRVRHFWFALNTELGNIGDAQTKDLARMYFVPAVYPGAHNFIFTNTGEWIDPSQLIAQHPYTDVSKAKSFLDRLPAELQRQVVEHRKKQLDNTNISWTSYRDCPFVSKKNIAEYMNISGTGWYHKMYQMMVSIAIRAIKRGYPITSTQIADLCREIDRDTGNWYENRPLTVEAENALEFAYRNAT